MIYFLQVPHLQYFHFRLIVLAQGINIPSYFCTCFWIIVIFITVIIIIIIFWAVWTLLRCGSRLCLFPSNMLWCSVSLGAPARLHACISPSRTTCIMVLFLPQHRELEKAAAAEGEHISISMHGLWNLSFKTAQGCGKKKKKLNKISQTMLCSVTKYF